LRFAKKAKITGGSFSGTIDPLNPEVDSLATQSRTPWQEQANVAFRVELMDKRP
jgi:hypothetical protein